MDKNLAEFIVSFLIQGMNDNYSSIINRIDALEKTLIEEMNNNTIKVENALESLKKQFYNKDKKILTKLEDEQNE